MAMIRSLVLSPARDAGLAGVRLAINAPDGRLSPRLSAISGVTAWIFAPSHGLLTTEPPLLAEATTTLTPAPPPGAGATTPVTNWGGMGNPVPRPPPGAEKGGVFAPPGAPPETA